MFCRMTLCGNHCNQVSVTLSILCGEKNSSFKGCYLRTVSFSSRWSTGFRPGLRRPLQHSPMFCSWPFLAVFSFMFESLSWRTHDWDQAFRHRAEHLTPECLDSLEISLQPSLTEDPPVRCSKAAPEHPPPYVSAGAVILSFFQFPLCDLPKITDIHYLRVHMNLTVPVCL